jgi:hypothetical protein
MLISQKYCSFTYRVFTDDELATFRDECELKHQNCVSELKLEGRLLVVIELIGDLNEDAWSRLYSASRRYAPRGSKIIVTSQFDNIVKFGTTRALTLKYLSHEAYWYFFKTLTFGSVDPEMHPRLTNLAMDIAKMLRRCHIVANTFACLLRDNFDVHFWCKILALLRRSYQKLVSRFSEHLYLIFKTKTYLYFLGECLLHLKILFFIVGMNTLQERRFQR